MVPCPFLGQQRYPPNDTAMTNPALVADAGLLDSHIHLGINTPPEGLSTLRLRMVYSPVNVADSYRFLGEHDGYACYHLTAS